MTGLPSISLAKFLYDAEGAWKSSSSFNLLVKESIRVPILVLACLSDGDELWNVERLRLRWEFREILKSR
jgi:hypothetical protein